MINNVKCAICGRKLKVDKNYFDKKKYAVKCKKCKIEMILATKYDFFGLLLDCDIKV